MKKIILLSVVSAFFAAGSMQTFAANKEDCVKSVKKAGDYLAKNGSDKTIAEINDPKGQFSNAENYLFASKYIDNFDSATSRIITLAHGANPKLIGKDLTDLKDANGTFFVRKFAEVSTSKSGEGWTDYKWPNPVTKQIEHKSTYTKRFDPLVISCGVYN